MPKRIANAKSPSKESRLGLKNKLKSIPADLRRRIYLAYRIPLLVTEMQSLVREIEQIRNRLKKDPEARELAEMSKLQERLIYLGEHRLTINNELLDLRKELRVHRKEQGTKGKGN
jgi:hypothetical protein